MLVAAPSASPRPRTCNPGASISGKWLHQAYLIEIACKCLASEPSMSARAGRFRTLALTAGNVRGAAIDQFLHNKTHGRQA